jgi:hypothetical protein
VRPRVHELGRGTRARADPDGRWCVPVADAAIVSYFVGFLVGCGLATIVFLGWIRDLREAADFWQRKYRLADELFVRETLSRAQKRNDP